MDDSIEGVRLSGKQCNVCDAHDAHERAPRDLPLLVDSLRQPERQFDVLLGISGGLDSSFLAMWAKAAGLRTLLLHFDNGFNAPAADRNIERVVEYTGFPFLRFRVPPVYYRMCQRLIESGTPDADIANDLGMAKLSLDVAKQYRIKTILNGHNYRTEGWNPIGWTYMDGRYLRSLCAPLDVPPHLNLGILEQFTSGVQHVRPYYAMTGLEYPEMRANLNARIGWEDYGGKHAENVYTEWVGARYLPVKFGIDKKRNYLSADVRCGRITRAEAVAKMAAAPHFDTGKLWPVEKRIHEDFDSWALGCSAPSGRDRFDSYRKTLKLLRPLVWFGMKARLVPEAFYRKYVKGG